MENLPVNITDIVVIVVILLSALLALARGFVREVLSIAGWVGAGFATYYALPHIREPARTWFAKEFEWEEPLFADIAAGGTVFIITLILFTLVTIFVSRRIQESDIGALDRSLGFLFGLARGAFLICLAYLILIQFIPPKEHPEWIKEAKALNSIQAGTDLLTRLTPKKFRDSLDTVESWEKNLKKQIEGAQDVVGGLKKTLDADSAAKEGYSKETTKEMDRLIQSTEEDKTDDGGASN